MPIPQHMDRPKEQRSIVLLLLHLILSMTLASSDTDDTATRRNPNFVFVLTDDLDKTLGGPETLAKTRQLLTLATNGVDLSNWFVHTPVCCPSRAEILTGRMLHNLKVPTATGGQGCMHIDVAEDLDHRFFSEYYFARHFAERNYTVGVFGKHLNTKNPSHPPPGVDRWLVNGGGDFFDPEFDWASAGVEPTRIRFNNCTDAHGEHLPCYSTSIIGNSSIAWIRDHLHSRSVPKPFFAYVSVKAPHIQDGPGFPVAIPAPWYADASVGTRAPRTPNYNASCPDHHWLVRQQQPLSDVEAFHVDRLYESRLRSLLSVDDLVEDLVSMLEEEGVLDNTYIVFTSDNVSHSLSFWLYSFGPPSKHIGCSVDSGLPARSISNATREISSLRKRCACPLYDSRTRYFLGIVRSRRHCCHTRGCHAHTLRIDRWWRAWFCFDPVYDGWEKSGERFVKCRKTRSRWCCQH